MKAVLSTAGILFLRVISLTQQVESAGNICTTPDGNLGHCIILTSCSALLTRLSDHSPENRRFLVLSSCGYEGRIPKVCCPSKEQEPPTESSKPVDPADLKALLPSECGESALSMRIVNGEEAQEGEFPWIARLEFKSFGRTRGPLLCGGALITDSHVLTAAHCAEDMDLSTDVNVVLGLTNTQWDSNYTITLPIEKVIVHKGYQPEKGTNNDIAMLKLSRKIKFNDGVQPICLPTKKNIPDDPKLQVAGWGKNEYGRPTAELRKVSLTTYDHSICARKYKLAKETVGPDMICAQGANGGDSCSGDSGGPLMTVNDDHKYTLVGLVSFGVGCGSANWPGVYANVEYFLPWIIDNLKSL